jgi:uncharacterized membrane protein
VRVAEEVTVADKRSSNGKSSDGRDKLGEEIQNLVSAVAGKVGSGASSKVGSLTEKLTDFASGDSDGGGSAKKAAGSKAGEKLAEGKSPVKAALSAGAAGVKEKVTSAFGGGKGGGGKGGKKLKVTNIIEEIDVGAPVRVVYDQWTQFQDFSGFMKKVEGVDQKDEMELTFKAQVLWSHRTWKSKIIEQDPDRRIVWRSSGEKGHVDGAVTFHEIGPELTRVLVVLEYHPQGLFERTGNLWRAQGRRVRLELKHFRRQVMMDTVLHPDDVDGWRGEIHDGDVAVSDEEAREREESEGSEGSDDEDYGDEAEDEYDDDAEDDEAEDDEAEDDEGEEDDDEDEADDEAEAEYDDAEDEESDEPEESDQAPARRKSARRGRPRAAAGRR